jgi:hypothetical protein
MSLGTMCRSNKERDCGVYRCTLRNSDLQVSTLYQFHNIYKTLLAC